MKQFRHNYNILQKCTLFYLYGGLQFTTFLRKFAYKLGKNEF